MELRNHRHQRWKKPIRSSCPCPLPARSASLQEVLQGVAELSSGQFLWNPFPGFSVGIFQWPGFSLMWQVQIGFLENTMAKSCIKIWRFQQNNTLVTLFLFFSLIVKTSHCHSWVWFLEFPWTFYKTGTDSAHTGLQWTSVIPVPATAVPGRHLGLILCPFLPFP